MATGIVTYELLFVLPELRERVAEHRATDLNVERDAVLINPPHTHYAPAYWTRPEDLDDDADDQQRLVAEFRATVSETLESVVDRAFEDLEPARLNHGRSQCYGDVQTASRRRPDALRPESRRPDRRRHGRVAVETDDELKGVLFG